MNEVFFRKNFKKLGLLLVVALVLIGGFVSLVPKAHAAAVITVKTAKITGPHQLTIVFNTSGQDLVAAPVIAYGPANDGADALTLASDFGADPRTIVDVTNPYPSPTFTAVYTFDGAAASVNDTGIITINNPSVITAGADTFTGVITVLVTDGQAPTVTAAVQSVTDALDQTVNVQSNEGTGNVYIILTGEPQVTVADLNAAFLANKGVKEAVITANTDVALSTAGLTDGVYHAYAVDAAGNISTEGTNAITVAAPAPTITSISPTSGPTTGGTTITIHGTGFVDGASVTIDGNDAAGVWVSDTEMTATTPADDSTGAKEVMVTNPDGGFASTGASPASVAIYGDYAYVVNSDSNTLQKFDISIPSSPSLVGTATTGGNPISVAVSSDGSYAYVANWNGNTLQKFDTSTMLQVGSDATTGDNPSSVAVYGDYAYVATWSGSTLQKFDTATMLQVGSNATTGSQPSSVAVSSDGSYAYVVNYVGGTLQKFDTSTMALWTGGTNTAITGSGPYSVAVYGNYAYVVNQDSKTLRKFNTATMSKVGSDAPTGAGNYPNFVAVSSDGSYAYVVNADGNTLQKFNTATMFKVGSDATTGSSPASVAVSGDYAYVVNQGDNTLQIFDISALATPSLVSTTPGGFTYYISAPAPAAETLTPSDTATGVALDAEVSILFDRGVTANDLSGITITGATQGLVGTVVATLGGDNRTVTIAHDAFADNSEVYTVDIPADAVINADSVGNDEITWSFTTAEPTPITYAVTDGMMTRVSGDTASTVEIATSPAVAGATVTLTVVPKTGMQLTADSLVATYNDSETAALTNTGTNTYTFMMPAYAVTVTAQFEAIVQSSGGSGGGNFLLFQLQQQQSNQAIMDQLIAQINVLQNQINLILGTKITGAGGSKAFNFTRDLYFGTIGEDVRQLQIYLNNNGFELTNYGAGSKGNETTMFGTLTEQALINFQKANNISPAAGFFGPITRAFVSKQ